ncbi:MAG TPA: protein kinase [Pyrinomonadaceae bacterium]|nr:protein kinase [Pyrinomonadaceae bacterium]
MIEPGKVLQQRYKIDRQIGQGGMGAVYVATDERFGSVVAIKETLSMDANYRKAIDREARLLNSLKHVALPRVSDHFIEENGQFIVMEYISGEDLGHVLEESHKPFPVEQVLTWADQLLDALDFLHNQVNPVIHRDIKPQNLKVTPKGQIILLDFGLAKGNVTDAGHQTAAKSIFGYSRNYASLEQIQGTGTDPRSDLYSLAATLYHLLTNTAPEDALTRAMAVLSRQRDPLMPAHQIVEDVPTGVAYVLQRALDLDAAQRPASAAAMREMLREHEKYESVAATVVDFPIAASANIHSQHTRLMPGATVGDTPYNTDVKTEIMGTTPSPVTSLRSDPQAMPKPKRKFSFATAAIATILLTVSIGAAGYFVYPELFEMSVTVSPEPQTAVPVPEEVRSIAVDTNAAAGAIANTGTDQASGVTANSANVTPANPVIKPTDQAKTARGSGSGSASNAAPARDPNKVVVDGETIYMGDMKITDDKIETPDSIIDDNGVTPKVPPQPGMRNRRMIPAPDLSHLTPEQRRRVMRALRRNNVIIVRPTPTPY